MMPPVPPPFPSRREALGLAVLGALGAGAALAAVPRGAKTIRRSALAFGTTVSITLVDDGGFDVEAAFADAFSAVRAVQRAADLFDPASELRRLEAAGRLERPSPDLVAMVGHALDLARATEGAFDPTVQPLWRAWREAKGLPGEAALTAVRARVDFRAVRLEANAIAFSRPGMAMTLNAVAQGHATDRVAAALAARGVGHAFLDTGELGARGRRVDGGGWRVAIADPRDLRNDLGRIDLGDRRFLATSADSATAWLPDFSEHHIVEPWSGHSPRELAEVVVEAPSGLVADGLSTAVMVLGREKGAVLIARTPGASALLVGKDGRRTRIGDFPDPTA